MNTSNTPTPTGKITFIQHRLPPLEAGEYRMSVEQRVSSTDTHGIEESFITEVRFAVAGERFRLDPAVVDSLYPPASTQGEFINVLPHITLTRRTLPWERSLVHGEKVQSAKAEDDVPSWLALLLFDVGDPAPVVKQGTVLDLVAPASRPDGKLPAGVLSYGLKHLDYGESYADPISMIDVPVGLFCDMAPTANDLRWLAHVRSVEGKTSASDETPAEYSVIVGNRLPRAGNKSIVHLVSLEGLADVLPGAPDQAKALQGVTQVRLVTLTSWSFDCSAEKQGFVQLLEAADASVFRRSIVPNVTTDAAADQKVVTALSRGYTAMNHSLRDGGNTVSFYRGPFVPAPVKRVLKTPISSADAALRYDPDIGMLDVSYAAAWELGRLLGLQNQEFASALYRWKLAHTREEVAQTETELLQQRIETHDANKNTNLSHAALGILRAALASRSKV